MSEKRVIIFGGDPAGVGEALKQAEAGNKVILVESLPSLGGGHIPQTRIIADDTSFVDPNVEALKRHPNIRVITNAAVEKTSAGDGTYRFRVRRRAPRVDPEKCNDCRACIRVCPIHMYDDFNEGIGFRTAIDYFNPDTRDYNIFKEDMPICQATCPANLDIRSYVGLIADGDYAASLAKIRERLPFALSIGRVCPHPCETACNRGTMDEPISICTLKRYVADYEMLNDIKAPVEIPDEFRKEKVAIIGAGPAGLTCGYFLAKAGYRSVCFEALPEPGGMFRYGIPEYRLPTPTLMREINWILSHGVELRCNTRIGKDVAYEDILKEYDAVFLGVGAHAGMKLQIKGEDMEGVVDGVDFLRDANMGKDLKAKGKVIIIGGGNVAMDAARVSWRAGFDEVHILYRRTKREMPASPWEIDAAEQEGIKIQYLVAPVEVIGENGRMTGLKCLRMELGEPDASGRRRPVPIQGSEFVVEAQTLIPAIGQRPDLSFVPEGSPLSITRWNTFSVDQSSFMTNVPGVFSAGDVETGPDIAIRACAGGRKAASGIIAYLKARRK
ncbi:FAD-dependent oxidoreductase [Syntrophobacter fumaroxidans]|uniref:FAD-dependent pyridine nucleotide-disulphide oxidoreductase n=1 Tax=Syntrophobacter fumaroxidans (strain DSM 10017 / MPOB) TaxID=335543 RepID=A0LHH2_SYNFM|nr:FAD-dependent oxidoreductase [Syntrophobacter fumaroxidans]ABK16874.1 FAD-dependent pyridine nucleotide-disulphide oxidoreductase [Syntrophobacter fumaroxidans MPOB]